MRARLIQAFLSAEKKYCAKDDRGIAFGIFSDKRHSFAKTKRMEALEASIRTSLNDNTALIAALTYILAPETTHNNHSFCSYFLAELKKITGDAIPDFKTDIPTPISDDKGQTYKWDSPKDDLKNLLAYLNANLDKEPAIKAHPNYSGIMEKDLNPCENDNPRSRYGKQNSLN